MGREDGDVSGRKAGKQHTKVISLDQYRWRKAAQTLRQKLGQFAADPIFSGEVSSAQKMYLAGINPGQVEDNDEILERCFEWFIFDYVMQGGDTLIDLFAAVSDTSDMEARLLREWSGSRLSVLEITGTSSGSGLGLRDLIFNRKVTVCNYRVSGTLDRGSVVFMRVLRVGSEYEFSTGGLALPPAFAKPLVKKIRADMDRYAARKGAEKFSPDKYLKDRAHRINFWVMDFAARADEYRGKGYRKPDFSMSSLIAQKITDTFLDDYYEKWVNQPVKALGGKTPRESCKTVHGRAKVDELLKELEKVERSRVAKGEPHYNIDKVRVRLGLIPGKSGGGSPSENSLPTCRNHGGEGYSWAKRGQQDVALMIRESLEGRQYTRDRIEGALRLWSDYCSKENPTVKSKKLWLAAVVYTLARMEFDGVVQQRAVADEFGVSPSKLSQKYRSMCRSLELEVFDRRYTPGRSPLEDLELSDPLLAKIFNKLKL